MALGKLQHQLSHCHAQAVGLGDAPAEDSMELQQLVQHQALCAGCNVVLQAPDVRLAQRSGWWWEAWTAHRARTGGCG